jgi:DNA-binding transcriptional regulator GbsR (MarR family)
MKRDMDLVRQILVAVDDATTTQGLRNIKIEGYSKEQISYHVRLLANADFMDAVNFHGDNKDHWIPRNLTWEGHELLDTIRNESVWNEAKERFKEQFVSMPFQILVPLLMQILKQQVGLPNE